MVIISLGGGDHICIVCHKFDYCMNNYKCHIYMPVQNHPRWFSLSLSGISLVPLQIVVQHKREDRY